MGFRVRGGFQGERWVSGQEMRLQGPGRLVNDLDYGVGPILGPVL